MKVYSYVVARDFGFAPNPFFGICTLATCKPRIRSPAQVGDWVLGTGSAKRGLQGRAVYAMRVTETMSYDEYWHDLRYRCKRPNLCGSKKQAFGDNIYHLNNLTGEWNQIDSHHSFRDGQANPANVSKDTKANKILLSDDFIYWGGAGPKIPLHLRDHHGFDICVLRQGHKCQFPEQLKHEFVLWIRSFTEKGYLGVPCDWSRSA